MREKQRLRHENIQVEGNEVVNEHIERHKRKLEEIKAMKDAKDEYQHVALSVGKKPPAGIDIVHR